MLIDQLDNIPRWGERWWDQKQETESLTYAVNIWLLVVLRRAKIKLFHRFKEMFQSGRTEAETSAENRLKEVHIVDSKRARDLLWKSGSPVVKGDLPRFQRRRRKKECSQKGRVESRLAHTLQQPCTVGGSEGLHGWERQGPHQTTVKCE